MFGHLGPKCLLDNSVKDTLVLVPKCPHWLTDVSRTGRFPDKTFPARHFPDTLDVSRTHLVRESSFWKRAFIVTSANNILSLIQLWELSVFTVNFNTLSEITAA